MLAGNIGLASVIDIVTMPEPAVVLELPPPSEHDRVASTATHRLKPQNNLNHFIHFPPLKWFAFAR